MTLRSAEQSGTIRASQKASPRHANVRAHGNEGMSSMQAQITPQDTELVKRLILKAVALPVGEAFDIGGADGIIVARSPSGQLWVGSGGINSGWTRWWRKGDPYENLAEACRGSLDWTQTGYFAHAFRDACRRTLDRPASKVSGVGRKSVRLMTV